MADELRALLAWSSLPKVGQRTLLALMDHARESRRTLVDLWDAPLTDFEGIVRLHPRARTAKELGAAGHWEQAAEDCRAIRERGIDVLRLTDPDSGPMLASGAARRWPFVFAFGAIGLLEEPRVAIVNSRDVSRSGLVVTDALADALACRDVVLVTSISRDSYRAAATAAKRHAAPTVMVLDRSIAEAFSGTITREPVAPARVWDESFDPDLQLLLSPFGWRDRWNPGAGLRRDALICDLAHVIVAIDVRGPGIIHQECARALAAGKAVVALDRGEETRDGTRSLWEREGNVLRVRWNGASDTVVEVLRRLPSPAPEGVSERAHRGWQREIAHFLIRACVLLCGDQVHPVVGAFPHSGVLAETAGRWSHRAEIPDGATYLLADLVNASTPSPSRPAQLLGRLAPQGLLAAVIPADWLDQERHARARAEWLKPAALRLAVRLPTPAGIAAGAPRAAAVFLQRSGRTDVQPAVFAPGQDTMGRFHLRRYLQEVLAAVSAEGSGGSTANEHPVDA